MHTSKHQDMLKNARQHGGVSAVEQMIQTENPRAFHAGHSLADRVFAHLPQHDIPMRGWVHRLIPLKVAPVGGV